MALVHRFTFPLPHGLHARPASHFHEAASPFLCDISIVNERNNQAASAKSVLSMIASDILAGDPCRIEIAGADQDQAFTAIRAFISDVLPHCDAALTPAVEVDEKLPLPRSLRACGLEKYIQATPAASGIAWAELVVLTASSLPPQLEGATSSDLESERRKVAAAIATVASAVDNKIQRATNHHESAVLKAHAAIIADSTLTRNINRHIDQGHLSAAAAIAAAGREISQTLGNSQSAYLRQRVLDIEDISTHLVDSVLGRRSEGHIPALTRPAICAALSLTPGQFLSLDRRFLKGLLLCDGAKTSHTIILARAMNIPTLVGLRACDFASLKTGQEIILDAHLGLAIPEITDPIRRYYQRELRKREQLHRRADGKLDSATTDGRSISIRANIAIAEEAQLAINSGADGVGLFRTEMLFMDRPAAPTEQEQTEIYTTAARAVGQRPLVIRLLDVGGDKPISYLDLPQEDNPFLGFRGARLYEQFAPLVKTQLRAILRASAAVPNSQIKILVPMISCVEEVRSIKAVLEDARRELGLTEQAPPLGVMIEVPSAALIIPELSREVDFFSIGSNDLIQYLLAADRGNPKVAGLYTWSYPAFLRILKKIVEDAQAHNKPISLCGEMSDSTDALPFLIGTGLTEISLSSPRIAAIRQAIAGLNYGACQKLMTAAAACATRAEVESLARQSAAAQTNLPLLSPDLVITSDGITKAEVIKDLTDALHLTGRVDRPSLLEEEIWKREDVYSTGFGHGFAVPHCKSTHLLASSIVIAKVSPPVDWNSLDEKPVGVVILLAISEHEHGQLHMKIFSRLSRLAMRDEFRQTVSETNDPAKLIEFLKRELDC